MATQTATYSLEGMTCSACVARVKRGLEALPEVRRATVSLDPQRAEVTLDEAVPVDVLQSAIGAHYPLTPAPAAPPRNIAAEPPAETLPSPGLSTYRPLLMIVGFIAGVSLLAQYPFDDFSGMLWMRHFMAGFFIVFAFFKLLNLEGFATSYAMYDIVAARWRGWGKVYPFVELALGVLYLIDVAPLWTNVATVVVLGVSSIGVIESNLNKRKIKCACLGDVFNLPMSTVTVVEDVGMVAMAVAMLLLR